MEKGWKKKSCKWWDPVVAAVAAAAADVKWTPRLQREPQVVLLLRYPTKMKGKCKWSVQKKGERETAKVSSREEKSAKTETWFWELVLFCCVIFYNRRRQGDHDVFASQGNLFILYAPPHSPLAFWIKLANFILRWLSSGSGRRKRFKIMWNKK